MELDLIKKYIPYDIIINNIIPYTYLVQSKYLLKDIHSYYLCYNIINDIYSLLYNDIILLNDLIIYMRLNENNTSISHKLYTLLRRNFIFINKNDNEIDIFLKNFYNNKFTNKKQKIGFLFGLLTHNERNRFIDNYILIEYYDYYNI